MPDKNYIIMLRESLEKKVCVLLEIQKANEDQKSILLDPLSTPEDLKDSIDRKDKLLDVIDALDVGFENMYKRVSSMIKENRELYKDEIVKMQHLIKKITGLSVTLQAEEKRNKDMATIKFSKIREQVALASKHQNVVDSYHKTMERINTIDPQFMDSKK